MSASIAGCSVAIGGTVDVAAAAAVTVAAIAIAGLSLGEEWKQLAQRLQILHHQTYTRQVKKSEAHVL